MLRKAFKLHVLGVIFFLSLVIGCGQQNDATHKEDIKKSPQAPQKPAKTMVKKSEPVPQVFQCDYFGQEEPGLTPAVFTPGAVDSTNHDYHGSLTFSLDGKEVYWSAYYKPPGSKSRTQHIFFRKKENNRWTEPKVASFSGTYHDGCPFIAPGGKKLFFYSNRPAEKGGKPSNENNTDIWVMERIENGWGEPKRLEFNTDKIEMFPTVSKDGTIYFTANYPGSQGPFDIYRSRLVNGKYSKPENIGPPINTGHIKDSPYIAPDESYIIFTYTARPAGNGLHISFRKEDGTWTTPINMGKKIHAASHQRFPGMSPDQRFFFFVRYMGRKRSIYWVDAGIIDQLRPEGLK